MFIDNIKIYVKAGNGGNGAVTFHREKYVAAGGPDGGDGGRGGSVIFRVDPGSNTLLAFRYKRKFAAGNGEDGKGDKMHGKSGEDVIISVPPGTLIKDPASGKIIHDMAQGGDFILCRGGRGGWGNRHFATPTRQIPRFAKSGTKGEEREVLLELKMIADVGLVGFPNVGKSSILSRISAAKPKIADYHFTTLSPNLGVVSTGRDGKGFVCADIPGLIEGASEGAGLGHQFLRHVDRCRLLIHVVDAAGLEGRDPVEDIKTIDRELAEYSPELSGRPQIVAANKIDSLDPESPNMTELEAFCRESGRELIPVSAVTGEGLDVLVSRCAERLSEMPEPVVYEADYAEIVSERDPKATLVRRENEKYIVEGEWLMDFVDRIDFNDYESLGYFQRVLSSNGVFDMLREKGIKEGDTVNIYGFEFDFVY